MDSLIDFKMIRRTVLNLSAWAALSASFTLWILLLFAVFTLAGCGGGGSKKSYSSNQQLDYAVNQARTSLENALGKTIPSLSVLIQTPYGLYFTSSTAPDIPSVTPHTYFRFASTTKNFTAAAILKMHQDGWLNYTDRIVDHIPGSIIPYVPDTPAWDIPYKDRITIRQLLQHDAGVYDVDNNPVPGIDGQTYVEFMLDQNPDHQFTATELVEQLAIHNLSFGEPGISKFNYSDTGYTILSEIIARVYSHHSGTQKSYRDYLLDHITGPFAPVPVDVDFPDQAWEQKLPAPYVHALAYGPDGLIVNYEDINVSAHVAEGNGYGTMHALNRYVRTLMTGQNVLSAQSVEAMLTDRSPGLPAYSLGTMYSKNIGYGHDGTMYGYNTRMDYDPDHDVSVIVMMPVLDWSDGMNSLLHCVNTLKCAAWDARAALGYPGRPEGAECPGG